MHQQITLHLHDGSRRRPDKVHGKVVPGLFPVAILIFLIVVSVVKSDLDGRTSFSQIVQAHAHLVEHLTKVFVARNRPAQVQQMRLHIQPDAGFFFVSAGCAIDQRLGPGVSPQGLERFLQLIKTDISTQGHFAVDMDFKRGVVTGHGLILPISGELVPGTGVEPVRPL